MLLALLFIVRTQTGIMFRSKQLLLVIIRLSILSIIMEPLSWVFDKTPSVMGYVFNYLSNFLIVLLSPLLTGLLTSYIDLKLFKDWKRLRRRWFYLQPAGAVFSLLLLNFFFPIFFTIDRRTNTFSQHSFVWLNAFMVIVIYLALLAVLIRHRRNVDARSIRFVLIFLAVPLIGMGIQFMNSRLNFSWTTVSLAILIAYTFLETTPGEKDFLTGLYSRSIYDRYVTNLINLEADFLIMMIDLNGFKAINDTEGHKAGDEVLRSFSSILRSVFHDEKMIARLAGDEFIVVMEHSIEDPQNRVDEVEARCLTNVDPLVRNLKFGYGIERHRPGMSFNELYVKVDEKMYTHKQKMKQGDTERQES